MEQNSGPRAYEIATKQTKNLPPYDRDRIGQQLTWNRGVGFVRARARHKYRDFERRRV